MIHFVTEQLAGDKVAEYIVSVLALDAWAKIHGVACDGSESAIAWASWDGAELSIEHVEGEGDRLFGEWPVSQIEVAIREAYGALPDCGDSGHPTACGCDDPGEFDSTVILARHIEWKMADAAEPWTLLQAMDATVCPEPTTATVKGRDQAALAIGLLVRTGRAWPVRVDGYPRFGIAVE